MPHPETQVHFEHTFKKEGLCVTQQLPEKKDTVCGEEARKIIEEADYTGVLYMNRPAIGYSITAKDGREWDIQFEPNWRIRYPKYHEEQYEEEAKTVADFLEAKGKAPIKIVLKG